MVRIIRSVVEIKKLVLFLQSLSCISRYAIEMPSDVGNWRTQNRNETVESIPY